ncbi:aminoglycoside 2'-N-acetyltransferase I [Williamsia limnetica]|uniref:Aminoglycoside 2'-N-acetyltransferase I n=1 Tax=Williamsia limnetica TaxID=882452 RepID=A0A318RJI0_WILLI|nr:GNAT family N-acetyltransferase [Williamsia limnetica]PYE15365.1 aminoglycoside 2'-N-acetyltransferase I [Williamsia limnetica]
MQHTWELSAVRARSLRALLDLAFAGDFADTDYDHALGGVHVFVTGADDAMAGHAAVVARSMMVDGIPYRVGYVEAVAVDPGRQRQGIGDQLMSAVERVIVNAYDFGVLSASEAGLRLYRSHGWRLWEGTLSAMTPAGVNPTPDDADSVFVFGGPETAAGELTCDWRAGDLW